MFLYQQSRRFAAPRGTQTHDPWNGIPSLFRAEVIMCGKKIANDGDDCD